MSYTVLARRYRSQNFDEVMGQEAIATTLKNAILTDHVHHAYLFSGTRGVGKTSMARILAKALNCLDADKPTVTPCGQCGACTAIATGEDIDVLEIDGASNTGVDHIRNLRANAIYRPARCRFKIYIIDEVHMLTTGAFNALLKTLEEPPDHVKFIFATTEPNKVLPTIQSRCQRFDFRNISTAQITAQLEHIVKGEQRDADPTALQLLARMARGSMRDAVSLLDQTLSTANKPLSADLVSEVLGIPTDERIADLVQSWIESDAGASIQLVGDLLGSGHSMEQLTLSAVDHCRNLLLIATCGSESELVELVGETRERALRQAQSFDAPTLAYIIGVLEELRRNIHYSQASRALLEATMVRLARSEHFTNTQTLLNRLQPASEPPESPATEFPSEVKKNAPIEETDLSASPALAWKILALQQNWDQICEQVAAHISDPATAAYLKGGYPAHVEQNQLHIAYAPQHKGMADRCSTETREKAIARALGEMFQRPVTLHWKLDAGADADALSARTSHLKSVQTGGRPTSQVIQKIMSEPVVRKAMEVFGGSVVEVRSQSNKDA